MKVRTIVTADPDVLQEFGAVGRRIRSAADVFGTFERLRKRIVDPNGKLDAFDATFIQQAYTTAQTWNAVHDRDAFLRLADEIESWIDATVFEYGTEKPKIAFTEPMIEKIREVREWIK